ncbi:MAG TPA: hypothetical protein DEQ20_11735 [Desulfobulbaceae bacterium]|nr:MAG: hypothetical protein A2520_09800 [Deltaproteobacteria bacterium RIFOXYD12_FULL_53_23]HCC55567.1 hypothetical protein [Desulfobulbaceae bacterium]
MPAEESTNTSAHNRRENFRIDDLLTTSVRKIENGILPVARIIPFALSDSGRRGAGLKPLPHEIDQSFALMLLEANARLDLLSATYKLPRYNEEKDLQPSMTQLLLQINTKLEQLLDFHHIVRQQEETRIGETNLSASGIKLNSPEAFATGDTVEVHLLLSSELPCWIVAAGSVTRTTQLPDGGFEVAIKFAATNWAIRDAIATYALKKQKNQLIGKRWLES